MVVVMKQDATDSEIEVVCEKVRNLGGEAFVSRGAVHTVIGLVGDTASFQAIPFQQLAGVDHVIQIGKPYKMVARDLHPEATTVMVGTTPVGRGTFTIIAGPCAVENEEMLNKIARHVRDGGATVLRGGVFKPRTSPYSFQGHGEPALKWMRACGDELGMPVCVEVMDTRQVEMMERYVDCFQIGARNMQNFDLLREVGKTRKGVLLKRGLAATVKDWLLSAEYVLSQGNRGVIMCERAKARWNRSVGRVSPAVGVVKTLPVSNRATDGSPCAALYATARSRPGSSPGRSNDSSARNGFSTSIAPRAPVPIRSMSTCASSGRL